MQAQVWPAWPTIYAMEQKPRIYLYKITFEEIPDWYWGIHKESKFDDGYLGSPTTHAWKWNFYTPELQICEIFPYTSAGWADAQSIEKRCIKPDLNNPLCLNEHCGGNISLEAMRRGGLTQVAKNRKEKRGLHGMSKEELQEASRRGVEARSKNVNSEGKQIGAVKANQASNAKKDANGKSVNAVKRGKATAKIKYYDPDHPELGEHRACNLSYMQKVRGFPNGKENRVKVSTKG